MALPKPLTVFHRRFAADTVTGFRGRFQTLDRDVLTAALASNVNTCCYFRQRLLDSPDSETFSVTNILRQPPVDEAGGPGNQVRQVVIGILQAVKITIRTAFTIWVLLRS